MVEGFLKKGLNKAEETLDTAGEIKDVMEGRLPEADAKNKKEGQEEERGFGEQMVDVARKTEELVQSPEEKPREETEEERKKRTEELMQKLRDQPPEETEEERKRREEENR